MRPVVRGAVAVVLLVCAFGYGFVSHRSKLFPYQWIIDSSRGVLTASDPGWELEQSWLWVQAPGATPDERLSVQPELARQLDALGYLQGYREARPEAGIIAYAPDLAEAGLNFYLSGHHPGAFMMTMTGEVLHTWETRFETACPDKQRSNEPDQRYWRRARLRPDGSVVAIFDYQALVNVDRDGRLIWSRCEPFHHDLSFDPEGNIVTLRRREHVAPLLGADREFLDDEIHVLDSRGQTLDRISVFDAFASSDYSAVLQRIDLKMLEQNGDILHTNTVRVLDGSQVDRHPAFKRGNLLVSLRRLDVISIIDPDTRRVVWSLGGMWSGQHDPILLANGNMLLFDNHGYFGKSKVVEFDPLSQKVAWSYTGGEQGFVSWCCGTNQRLANGNTLITDSANGRAVEVTPDGEVAWEFWNPHRAGKNDELVAVLLDVIRLPDARGLPWLENRGHGR